MSEDGAKLSGIAEFLNLKNFTEEMDLSQHYVRSRDINRPALQLNGFFEHFDPERIQLIGMVEWTYLNNRKTEEERKYIFMKLLSQGDVPCIIFCRGFVPEPALLSLARARNVPLLGTERGTSEFLAELIYRLRYDLAPTKRIHGVMVDVYGEGLMITGESGIGKSEAALELIRRGHRLVADDVVELRKIDNHTIIGSSPDVTKHLIELRGIGIIDVKSLYGVECVEDSQQLDFVIKLEPWEKEIEYERFGLEDEYIDILDTQIVRHSLPIRPGRNLAVICETAAVNHRQKKMGYNAAAELYRRVQENMVRK
ncbi:MAG: HPr(Ser) kinase/phosphatase [Lachnospiraceae bacterium]|nr:HPr(Ser) kinase/phosphatase [Lachnospiraceae bacterium]